MMATAIKEISAPPNLCFRSRTDGFCVIQIGLLITGRMQKAAR
jgi:hypothetical protein